VEEGKATKAVEHFKNKTQLDMSQWKNGMFTLKVNFNTDSFMNPVPNSDAGLDKHVHIHTKIR